MSLIEKLRAQTLLNTKSVREEVEKRMMISASNGNSQTYLCEEEFGLLEELENQGFDLIEKINNSGHKIYIVSW